MTAVDLTFARARARDRVLLDRVTITRNPRGQRNADFDEETGTYTTDPDETTTLGTDIPALARDAGTTDVQFGGQTVTVRRWAVKLGYEEAPEGIHFGDKVTFTTSEDPELEGKTLSVNDIVAKTLRIFREVECVLLSDGAERK